MDIKSGALHICMPNRGITHPAGVCGETEGVVRKGDAAAGASPTLVVGVVVIQGHHLFCVGRAGEKQGALPTLLGEGGGVIQKHYQIC